MGHIGWRWIPPCARADGPHDAERILSVANCPVVLATFDLQISAGPFKRLPAIVVFPIAPFPVPVGVQFHGTTPPGFVADRCRHRKLEAFRCQQEDLSVKVGVPGVHRNISRGERLHQARPDLSERWRVGELFIGDSIDKAHFSRHRDIRFAERLIEHLAVLIHRGDLDDLAAPRLQLAGGLRILSN